MRDTSRASRRHNTQKAIDKQRRIIKALGGIVAPKLIEQPHRLHKHHALDCGIPGCIHCSNPRKVWGQLTFQERKSKENLYYD